MFCDQFSELFNKGKTDSVSAQRIIWMKRVFHCFHFSLQLFFDPVSISPLLLSKNTVLRAHLYKASLYPRIHKSDKMLTCCLQLSQWFNYLFALIISREVFSKELQELVKVIFLSCTGRKQ